MSIQEIINWDQLDKSERKKLIARPNVLIDDEIRTTVEVILEKVKESGDLAIKQLTLEYDDVSINDLKMTDSEIKNAIQRTSNQVKDELHRAIENITIFHENTMPSSSSKVEVKPGVFCEKIIKPINNVGLYIPAGRNPLPSTAIMLGVPSRLAGTKNRILCSPPNKDGLIDDSIVTAASFCGITEMFKIGGAQAIAALAYGTDSVNKVDKVFGPGNSFVTMAKTILASTSEIAIDMPAGPTEVLVISDGNTEPDYVAYDLLSQAEHGPDSQVIHISPDRDFLENVQQSINRIMKTLETRDVAQDALLNSKSIWVQDIETAIDISNNYAPEHLIVSLDNPRLYLDSIESAGSIFLGYWSPESAGDYCSGTNHVLPTAGYAKSLSGVSVESFTKSVSIQELTKSGLKQLSETISLLARVEGLEAHAKAVEVRLSDYE